VRGPAAQPRLPAEAAVTDTLSWDVYADIRKGPEHRRPTPADRSTRRGRATRGVLALVGTPRPRRPVASSAAADVPLRRCDAPCEAGCSRHWGESGTVPPAAVTRAQIRMRVAPRSPDHLDCGRGFVLFAGRLLASPEASALRPGVLMPWSSSRPRSDDYGWAHAQARADAARDHRPDHPCTRCGKPLGPMGPGLHYDHRDDRSGYAGFAHARCNVRAGARKGRASQGVTRLRW
jgi:hypothetical protein